MSGRRARRRRAAAPRTPAGARRQASPRVLLAAALVLLLVGAGIGLAVATSGGSRIAGTTPAVGSLRDALPGAAAVHALFRGIPQRGEVLGRAGAPVTLVEYVDLQCPYCRAFATSVLPGLVSAYVRPGKLRIELRLLAFIGPDSERGRAAALAAGRQGRLFDLVELLYDNQGAENAGWLSEAMVERAAASIPGLDVPALLAARKDVAAEERAVEAQAKADAVSSTPTVLVGRTGGRLREVALASPTDSAAVGAAIRAALG